MSFSTLPAFAIVVRDNRASEYYFSKIRPQWNALGVNVQRFDATTPDTLPDGPLKFFPINTLKYKARGYRKEFTPTEMAVWYSHYRLWRECFKMNKRILVLEHDANIIRPELLVDKPEYDFISYDIGAMGAYILSPRGAALMIDVLSRRKFEIKYGPMGHVVVTKYYERKRFKTIISHGRYTDGEWVPAVNHLYNEQYGTTIDHYTGTQAENDPEIQGYRPGVLQMISD